MTTTLMTDLASVENATPIPSRCTTSLRSGSPVLHEPSADAWMIFDYDGVKRALNDHESFSSSMLAAGRRHPEWLIFFDPPRTTVSCGI
jgi:cytochrome P450